jgi:hypothetical protein
MKGNVRFSNPPILVPVSREAFSHMATQCLTYLSFEDFNGLPVQELQPYPHLPFASVEYYYRRLELYPFLKFAQRYRPKFVLYAKLDAKIDSLWMAFDHVSTNTFKLNLAFHCFYENQFQDSKFGVGVKDGIIPNNDTALAVAVYHGMDEIVYRLIDNGSA